MNSQYTPLYSLFQTIRYVLARRIHFCPDQIGAVFVNEQGRRFRVFRSVVVDPAPGQPAKPGAVFIPQFRVAGMSVRLNRLFSVLPIPFYVGLPGFRSKRWMVDEVHGDFAGYYEWDTPALAEAYAHSYAAKFMTGRSVPGSVSFRVYPSAAAPAAPTQAAGVRKSGGVPDG